MTERSKRFIGQVVAMLRSIDKDYYGVKNKTEEDDVLDWKHCSTDEWLWGNWEFDQMKTIVYAGNSQTADTKVESNSALWWFWFRCC